VGFLGKLLFEEPNSEARQRPFQGVELERRVHPCTVGLRREARNLVVWQAELVRWEGFDSACKTVDRGG